MKHSGTFTLYGAIRRDGGIWARNEKSFFPYYGLYCSFHTKAKAMYVFLVLVFNFFDAIQK